MQQSTTASSHLSGDETAFPTWTSYVPSGAVGGRFPLGLEAVGQNMIATHMLPGVTDATVHPRYFSFFAWAFATFEQRFAQHWPASKRARAQHAFRARLENALRSCTLAHGSVTQRIIGSRGAFRFEGLSSVTPISFPRALPSGIDPANYGASFVGLGLGFKSDGRMHTEGLGLELAAAFEHDLTDGMTRNERRALELLLDIRRPISVHVYELLTERFRIRSISPREQEHAPLVESLFRLQGPPPAADQAVANAYGTRARGLCLLLELVRQSEGSIQGPSDFFDVLAKQRFSDGRRVSLSQPSLANAFAIWRRYLERQWQKTIFNAMWHETQNVIEDGRSRPVSAGQIVSHCLSLARTSGTLRNFLGNDALARSGSQCLAAIEKDLPKDAGQIGTLAMELTQRACDTQTKGEERVGCAVVLLLMSVANWRRERPALSSQLIALHQHGGAARLSLPWMVQQVEQRADGTLSSLLEWIVEWCVLSQSMRVAFEKIEQGDRFFIHRVDGGYCLAQKRRDPRGYFVFDSSRLSGSFSLLRKLRLVNSDYRVTRSGERIQREALRRWGE